MYKKRRQMSFAGAFTLPVSQCIPVNPDWQMHWNELIWWTHVPCRQGELRHSSMSEDKRKSKYCIVMKCTLMWIDLGWHAVQNRVVITLPISQCIPVNPDWQMHWYELIWSIHVPCRQGELRHSSMSMKNENAHIVF